MREFSIRFLTRPGCHLCAEAEFTVRRLAGEMGVGMVMVDVDAEAELSARFGLRVPVVLDPEGTVMAEGAIEARPLRRALRRRLRHRQGD